MRFIKNVIFTVLCIGNISGLCALENAYQKCPCEHELSRRIYATPDQILITPNEIWVYSKDRSKLFKADHIGKEEGRIYVTLSAESFSFIQSPVKRGPCGIHPVWHRACGGCGVLLCPMNCTCFD